MNWPAEEFVPTFADRTPAEALDQALLAIEARYGDRTADVVAMQLEYASAKELAAVMPTGVSL